MPEVNLIRCGPHSLIFMVVAHMFIRFKSFGYIAINYVVLSLIITLAVIKKEKYIEYKNQLR